MPDIANTIAYVGMVIFNVIGKATKNNNELWPL
jgi:hypothetical protein